MIKQCNLVEFFSGIGSQYRALKNLGITVNTLATCEWDIHALVAYDLIHNCSEIPKEIATLEKEDLLNNLKQYTLSNSGKQALEYDNLKTYSVEALRHIYASIVRNNNFVDISSLNGDIMPENIDILTYSFPCQDLSNVGALHGYTKGIDKDSGSRSSLLWQVGRILAEMKNAGKALPRFLLMENVPTLLSNRHYANFSTWINNLSELGYVSRYYQLNAISFGLPQNRPRLLMISVYVGDNVDEKALIDRLFSTIDETSIIQDYRNTEFFHQYKVQDLLRTQYGDKQIMDEAVECTPNDTVSRRKIWEDNAQIVLPGNVFNDSITFVRTITTKQDRNPNSGNLFFDSGIPDRSQFRYLTPRECMLFMGFKDDDYLKLKSNNIEIHKGDALFARDKIIRMSGNSIPVKLLEGVFLQIMQIEETLSLYRSEAAKDLFGNTLEENWEAKIRSKMFSRGIRARVTSGYYPENADIVYQKYKTAVYIQDCLSFPHSCMRRKISSNSFIHLEKLAHTENESIESEQRDAAERGWNIIVLFPCVLSGQRWNNTMEWLESYLKKNTKPKATTGEIIVYG